MPIVKPENMDFSNKNIIMIISGLPGVGKTTLALSAPDCILVDADEGIVRVSPAHRKDSVIVQRYEDLLHDIKSLGSQYKTVIIDTCGALIELMKDWAMRTEPSANKKNGGFSQQGYGFIKTEFLRLSAELRKKFNVILLFHTAKDKNGEDVFYDIVCEGSAKTMVWQPADLGAYLHIHDGERYLGFSPTASYNAKAAYGIRGLVKVPELKDGDSNTFLATLFEKVKDNIASEGAQYAKGRGEYDLAMKTGRSAIDGVSDPESAHAAAEALKKIPHALTSQKELSALFNARLKELGIRWNKEAGAYEQIPDHA